MGARWKRHKIWRITPTRERQSSTTGARIWRHSARLSEGSHLSEVNRGSTLPRMKILNQNVPLDEVLGCYDRENQGSASFVWARGYLAEKSRECGGNWTLVLLSTDEVSNIML